MKSVFRMIALVLLLTALFCLSGCDIDPRNSSIARMVNDSVILPEQYSIAYKVISVTGDERTVKKVRDTEGNVYFANGKDEALFIKDDNLYTLYEKDVHGSFTAKNETAIYNENYVDSCSLEFMTYAERSKQRFLPSMDEQGEKEVLGRNCSVYNVSIGSDNTGVSYTVLVDRETGVCMGWDEAKAAFGHGLGIDGEVFTCIEFVTTEVPSLRDMID